MVTVLRSWLCERNSQGTDILFPNARGTSFSPDGVEYLVAKHVAVARERCPSLKKKKVSPHVLRHTTAMNLLQHGVDHCVIALWLGHESPETTQMYIHANMELKEQALARTKPLDIPRGRYRADDHLVTFLKSL
jgi:site-specific recombinase XerD